VKSWLNKDRLLAGTIMAGASVFGLAGPALAQDSGEEEAIIVTGSRIPQPNLISTSPVTQVTAEDITTQGVTRLEDLTNELPQVFAAQGSNVSNGASGTAQVDLRGLGAARTLVLINGRRMGYGSPNSAPADLNQIPGALVERVEVLTGGASAVYGSDAISGVVNFIMRDDFEGLRLDAQYGFYQHTNDSDNGFIRDEIAFRGATNPAQFRLPEDDVVDGYGKELTAIFGASTADGRGNITAYLGYRNNDAVLQRDRDYSACALGNGSTAARPYAPAGTLHWTCGGSGTSFPGTFTDFATFSYTIDQTTGAFIPFNSSLHQYNFGPLNYYQRPDERYTGGFFARYEINDSMEAYATMMFSDYRSIAQIAPSGDFFSTGTINCGNPLLTAGNAAAIGCSPADIAADTPTTLYIGRRNVEGGGRQDDLNYESYRMLVGLRGPLGDSNWDYDVYGQFNRVNLSRSYLNDFSVTRLNRALDIVDVGGTPTCRSVVNGTDPNCVPWDIFTPGGVTAEALAYLQVPLLQRGEAIQQNVVGTITGDTGLRMPSAETALQVAVGVEYRRDEINSVVDENFQTGNASGQGGPTLPLSGVTDVVEIFGEARFPLVENAPFADLLSIDAAYRYSDYLSGVTTDTYKVGVEWAPTEDFRIRGSFQRAVRAANVIELFTSQGFGLFDADDDPCGLDDGGDGIASVAACVGANPWQVTAAQYGSAGLNSPAGQYNGLFGGNPNLNPEEADTFTAGIVLTPSFLRGFSLSVDYFDIEVVNLVSTTGATNTLNDCYFNGTLASCQRIVRNPGTGQLWIGAGRVEDLNTNIGGLQTSGVDINASYAFEIGSMGGINLHLVGTYLEELITDPGAATGVAPYDCKGSFGAALCGTPNPEWRHRFRVEWNTPWNLDLFGTWRHYSEVQRVSAANVYIPNTLDSDFDAQNYFDLSGNYALFENTNIRFGVNNVFDEEPPISANVGAGFGNGNTYPQVYDALGRWVFAGVTVDF
jgi:outer membrane receptor protein involved in Fe transport